MSIYTSFNIAQQALTLNQSAINVVSSNISNMNTEGYSKQKVNAVSNGSMDIIAANQTYRLSAGAQIGAISRYREAFLDTAYRDQNSNLSYYTKLSNYASVIESSLNELSGSGLSDSISSYFTSLQTLQASPSDSTARVNFVQKAQILCTQFNQLATSLSDKRSSLVGNTEDPQSIFSSELYGNLSGLNNKLTQLAEINNVITRSTQNNTVSNDLLDQRDQILDEISEYMPISVVQNDNNSVNLSINGVTVVKGNVASQFDVVAGTAANPTTIQLKNADGEVVLENANSKFTSGSVAACLEMGSASSDKLTFQSMLSQLDSLASAFAASMNEVQTYSNSGVVAMGITFDASGKPILSDFAADGGVPELFSDSSGTGTITAKTMKVNQAIIDDYWKVATARVDTNVVDWDPKAVGNAENVRAFSAIRNSTLTGLGNMTAESYLTNVVSNMGSAIESIEFNTKAQNSLYDSIDTQRQSAIGVNLDEELVDLVKYQRAYEASARIFTVASEIMQQMVNLGR